MGNCVYHRLLARPLAGTNEAREKATAASIKAIAKVLPELPDDWQEIIREPLFGGGFLLRFTTLKGTRTEMLVDLQTTFPDLDFRLAFQVDSLDEDFWVLSYTDGVLDHAEDREAVIDAIFLARGSTDAPWWTAWAGSSTSELEESPQDDSSVADVSAPAPQGGKSDQPGEALDSAHMSDLNGASGQAPATAGGNGHTPPGHLRTTDDDDDPVVREMINRLLKRKD